MVNLRHRAKFRGPKRFLGNIGEEVVRCFKFLAIGRVKRVELRHLPNFVEIAQTAAEMRFSIFQDGVRRHLGFLFFF